ncbi:DUF4382 domain-containing protein [Cyclobacterium qasimii]|uniref:DUF4382 domain-containing protein n=2 Tax=Cyclobacterium qasimii TaxID=1350429 RepID=A0A512CH26_9BACT|nr:DUF4382 domain-containing protein [Cyclobacterium qasimii]EPR69012.1 putative lipoprotein [Cyclobacterium qasimii M12-11B]GEO23486.1 hypothetical protein CQA01_40200 [Cyclobacterium qasimii]
MKKNKTYFFGLCLLGLTCLGCTEATETRALVNLLLIDAPGDFDEVWVEVDGVEILPAGIRGSEENASWVSIPYQAASNMVLVSALVDDTQLLIGRTEIPAGDISKVRFLLGDVVYLISDDVRTDMTISPDSEALLELDVDISTQSGFSYDIILDLDLAQSVVANQSGGFNFVPHLRVFVSTGLSEITGTILPISIAPHVMAISATDTFSTLTSDDGGFLLSGLPEDEYAFKIAAPTGYQDTTFTLLTYPDSTLTLESITLQASTSP